MSFTQGALAPNRRISRSIAYRCSYCHDTNVGYKAISSFDPPTQIWGLARKCESFCFKCGAVPLETFELQGIELEEILVKRKKLARKRRRANNIQRTTLTSEKNIFINYRCSHCHGTQVGYTADSFFNVVTQAWELGRRYNSFCLECGEVPLETYTLEGTELKNVLAKRETLYAQRAIGR